MTGAFGTSLRRRLASYGIPKPHIRPLIDAFDADNSTSQHNDHLSTAPPSHTDRLYTPLLYQWATDRSRENYIRSLVPSSTIHGMRRLVQAVDMKHPTDSYVLARTLRRKIIMHVGPTNSGKTHHALRALAAAQIGIY